jgi:hypothetical protein
MSVGLESNPVRRPIDPTLTVSGVAVSDVVVCGVVACAGAVCAGTICNGAACTGAVCDGMICNEAFCARLAEMPSHETISVANRVCRIMHAISAPCRLPHSWLIASLDAAILG